MSEEREHTRDEIKISDVTGLDEFYHEFIERAVMVNDYDNEMDFSDDDDF